MIIRFTNIFNEVNHGIIIDEAPNGLKFVHWDTFAALLTRLAARGRVTDFVRRGLSVRQSWVRAEAALPAPATMELLPLWTPVAWNCDDLAMEQARLLQGKQVSA